MHLLPQLKALKVSHAQYYVMSETSAALETFFVRELFLKLETPLEKSQI